MTTYFHQPSGKYFQVDQAFNQPITTPEGDEDYIQRPAGWLKVATAEDLAENGFAEVVTVGTREDERYFFVTDELVGNERRIVNTPKPPEMVAQLYAAEVEAKKAKVRELRELTINRVNGIADRHHRKGNPTIRTVADGVVEALLDLTKNLPTDPAQAEVTMMQRYAVIVASLMPGGTNPAPELINAFAEMDQ